MERFAEQAELLKQLLHLWQTTRTTSTVAPGKEKEGAKFRITEFSELFKTIPSHRTGVITGTKASCNYQWTPIPVRMTKPPAHTAKSLLRS